MSKLVEIFPQLLNNNQVKPPNTPPLVVNQPLNNRRNPNVPAINQPLTGRRNGNVLPVSQMETQPGRNVQVVNKTPPTITLP